MKTEEGKAKGVTSVDLRKALAKEIELFIEENRQTIIKRAHKRIKEEGKR